MSSECQNPDLDRTSDVELGAPEIGVGNRKRSDTLTLSRRTLGQHSALRQHSCHTATESTSHFTPHTALPLSVSDHFVRCLNTEQLARLSSNFDRHMSRLASPRASDSAAVSTSTAAVSVSPPPANQHLSLRPPRQLVEALTSPAADTVLSPYVSVTPPAVDCPPLPLLPADPALPELDFPFYSSTSLCAPHCPPSPHAPSRSIAARPLRPFFRSSISRGAEAAHRLSPPPLSASSVHSAASLTIRSYRRRLPAPSIVESLRILSWPHQPTSHTQQSRDTYLSLLTVDEQHTVQAEVDRQMAVTAGALLAALDVLELLCTRPYDLALHRIRPNEWQLPCRAPLLSHIVAPLLSSLGLLREREEWIVGEKGAAEVRGRVRHARTELALVVADSRCGDGAVKTSGRLVVETERQQRTAEEEEEQGGGLREREHSESADDDNEYDERSAAMPAPLLRHKSLHAAPMPVRPMPAIPTVAHHDRSTFKVDHSRSTLTQQPASLGAASSAMDVPHSSRTEAAAHPKTLSADVAGKRRTMPVVLPHTFLSAAPTIDSTGSEVAPFTVQPAVLDLGPLLVGCTYTACVLLTNTSSKYARYEVLLPAAANRAASSSLQCPSPFSVSFAFRRGGLSAGLSQPLTAIIACTSTGTFECDVVVAAEAGSVRLSVCAECMDDTQQWRRAQSERERLSAGELGQTIASGLPGSLKHVHSTYGRVKEVRSRAEEESKEQILSAAVLSRWTNQSPHH